MSSKIRVLVADTTCPYFNLATEDWIFHDMDPATPTLFLWRNEPSIIIGRAQNVWSECLLKEVERDGVNVVRRHSGGGAVYQDLKNTCFTFMRGRHNGVPTKELYAQNNAVLVGALRRLGVEASPSGRNDIVVERPEGTFKVSGSAFKESRDRCFHHGTMLMGVDLTRLSHYLTPDSKKLQAKGIKSVRARVMNLTDIVSDIDHERFCLALIEEFFSQTGHRCPIEHLDREALSKITSLFGYYEKLRSWDWIFGKTPNFQHTMKERFPWGGCELHLNTDKGHISEAAIYTDSLYPDLFDVTPKALEGRPYSPDGIAQAEQYHLERCPDHHDILTDFYRFVESEL